ncbi:MAG: diacylglycerol kinase family lipid kinase [Vagococcus sp.]
MKNPTLHIIVNPQAGSGNAKKTLDITRAFITKEEVPYHLYLTEYPGHEKIIAKELMETVLEPWHDDQVLKTLLVVIGGDGTLHEVINTLASQPLIPVAYLPAGSGNDFARGLGLTRKTKKDLARLIKVTKPTPIPLIATQFEQKDAPQLVLNNIGIGLDANIVSTANNSKTKDFLNKIHLGSLAYLASIFHVLKEQHAFPVTFDTLGEKKHFKKAYLCSITNHPYFGGGVAIDPTANIKQAKMSVVLLEKVNLAVLIYLVIRLLMKNHLSSKYIHHFVTDQLAVTSTHPEFCQTDGEIVGKEAQVIQCTMTSRLFWI